MGRFTHTVREARERVSQSHEWVATIAGYDIIASRDGDDGLFSLSIAPVHYGRGRLGIVRMHPRSLSELEAFAEIAPTLLREVVTALRDAIGTDDLRSRWDKMSDETQAAIETAFKKPAEASE